MSFMNRGMAVLLGAVALGVAAAPAASHPVRLGCTNNPLHGHAIRMVVDFRTKCNYPIHELRFRIVEGEGSFDGPTIVGSVQSVVKLRKPRNWKAELGPFVEPPSKAQRAHQRLRCHRKPKLPRGRENAFVLCLGHVQPGTVMEGSFETLESPCGASTEVSESSTHFNVCHRRCIPWGFGSATWRTVPCDG